MKVCHFVILNTEYALDLLFPSRKERGHRKFPCWFWPASIVLGSRVFEEDIVKSGG
jgi:hypothetical protein